VISVPERRCGETLLDYLQRKEEAFGLWQAEAMQRIYDIEAELFIAQGDCTKYRTALNQIYQALCIVAKHAMLEGHEISANDFARDFAPFANVMAHHKIEPYAKPAKRRKSA